MQRVPAVNAPRAGEEVNSDLTIDDSEWYIKTVGSMDFESLRKNVRGKIALPDCRPVAAAPVASSGTKMK